MMWEDRPWWFNLLFAWPILIACIAFFPILYFLVPPFKRLVDGMCEVIESDYNRIVENHKLDPLPSIG